MTGWLGHCFSTSKRLPRRWLLPEAFLGRPPKRARAAFCRPLGERRVCPGRWSLPALRQGEPAGLSAAASSGWVCSSVGSIGTFSRGQLLNRNKNEGHALGIPHNMLWPVHMTSFIHNSICSLNCAGPAPLKEGSAFKASERTSDRMIWEPRTPAALRGTGLGEPVAVGGL